MKKVDANQVTAIAAVVVSFAALFVAWDQARIMRQQQKAAVMPVVRVMTNLELGREKDSVLRVEVENVGVGPAFIRGERVLLKGRPLTEWSQFARTVSPNGFPSGSSMTGENITGALVAPGNRATMIRLTWPSYKKDDGVTKDRLFKLFGLSNDGTALEVTLCYCSVFNQCWMTQEVKGELPVEKEDCPTSWVPVSLDFEKAESLMRK